jgi:cytochrome P450
LEDELRGRTIALLDAIEDDAPFDFVTAVASELPMQAICILLGVPEDDRHELGAFFDAGFDIREGDAGFADTGPTAEADAAAGGLAMLDYCVALVAAKRAAPTDDMLSVVVHATLPDVEPAQLTDVELYSFFSLLFAAGAQTTRHAIAGGVLALLERPDQLPDLRADPGVLGTAIEEVLRWTTPSPAKRRTVAQPAILAGHAVTPGEKVLFWEASANRDEQVFDHPTTFDIRRDPNPHLALGRGAHYCLGANLARLEMRVVFEEVLSRFPAMEQAGAVEWTRSNRHSGIRHLPIRMRR